MIIFLYTVIFAAFLNGGGCIPGGGFFGGDIDIDSFKFEGDPIKFVCILNSSQNRLDITHVNGSIPPALIERLDNGKGLSLLFYGVATDVNSRSATLFQYMKEWFANSQNNICVVSYAYASNSSQVLKMYPLVNKMVKTRRLEYVAKMTRDLVFSVRGKCLATPGRSCLRNLSQVDVSGFSFGAHIAGRACKYLFKKTKEKVRLLLALDPIKVPRLGPKLKDSFKKGAMYVQVVHTSKEVGIWDPMGDVDIYPIYQKPENLNSSNDEVEFLNDAHGIAFAIHFGTSTKRLFIWVKEAVFERGCVWPTDDEAMYGECKVGVYSTQTSHLRGKKMKLNLSRHNLKVISEKIGSFDVAKLYLGSQKVEKEENIADDTECSICSSNKKTALLLPCKHKEICVSCWNIWKNTPKFEINRHRCPHCREKVTKFREVYE